MGKDWASCALASGRVLCEVLDESGHVIPGLSREDCVAFRRNCPKGGVLTWKERPRLDFLKGRKIRLKFHLREADLYSFWLEPDADRNNSATAPMQI